MHLRMNLEYTSTAFWQRKETYEILTPESVGVQTNQMILGKHSGKHAFTTRLEELGYKLTDEEIATAFSKIQGFVRR